MATMAHTSDIGQSSNNAGLAQSFEIVLVPHPSRSLTVLGIGYLAALGHGCAKNSARHPIPKSADHGRGFRIFRGLGDHHKHSGVCVS